MKILTNQTIYQCEYCGKRLLSKNGAKIHESTYCTDENSPNQIAILEKQQKCKHENTYYRYCVMDGEDYVMEPDYEVCADCGFEGL